MKKYCEKCQIDREYTIKNIKETIMIKDVSVEVIIKKAFCDDCGEQVFVRKIQLENDRIIFDAYKATVGLLTSSDIINVREKYNLTQLQMAKLLNIGEKNITRYENGSIQDRSIDLLIRILDKVGPLYVERIKNSNPSYKDYTNMSLYKASSTTKGLVDTTQNSSTSWHKLSQEFGTNVFTHMGGSNHAN